MKKNLIKYVLPLAALLIALILIGCPDTGPTQPPKVEPGEEENPVTGIAVRYGDTTITEGRTIWIDENEEISLTVRLFPTDVEATVTWTQSNSGVQVTPAAKGLSAVVKGLSPGGSLIITVSATNADTAAPVTRTFTVSVRAPNGFIVTFDANAGGGTVSNMPQTITGLAIDAEISRPTDPQRNGYSFAGWYKDAEGINPWNFSTDTVSSNITLFAKWAAPLPQSEAVLVYYWLGANDTIATAGGPLAITGSGSVTFSAAGDGYTIVHCFINGIADANFTGGSYTFSAAGAPNGTHAVEVALLISKGGKYYSAEFTVTVTK